MGNYLLVNDIHLSDRAPSSCTDSYLHDLFGLLEETVALAGEHDCEGVVWAGDVFHHKTPGRTSHGTVMSALHIAESYPCPLWIVPGNHDLSHDRLDSIDQTQPLGVLFAAGAAELLAGWAGHHPIYGVPWLQRFDDDSVGDALEEWRTARATVADPGPALVITHAPLYPPGQELKFEFYPAEAWAAAMGSSGSVHYGHVHEPHGIYTAGGVSFSNPGALSRGSLHEHNLTRQVKVALWSDQTGDFQHLTVPHKPAAEVFRLKEAEQAKTAALELDQFLESVGHTRLAITSTEAVLDHIRRLGVDRPLEAALVDLLESA